MFWSWHCSVRSYSMDVVLTRLLFIKYFIKSNRTLVQPTVYNFWAYICEHASIWFHFINFFIKSHRIYVQPFTHVTIRVFCSWHSSVLRYSMDLLLTRLLFIKYFIKSNLGVVHPTVDWYWEDVCELDPIRVHFIKLFIKSHHIHTQLY